MNSEIFRNEITRLITEAKEQGLIYVDIISREVHKNVGGYPSKNHSMPLRCDVMYSMKKSNDEILYAPPKGKGATLKIRYYLS